MSEELRSSWKTLLVFLLVYVLWGSTIACLAPYRGFPDEAGHLDYIRYIRLHHELPKLSYSRSEIPTSHAFHPPLYYLCAAPLFQPSWSLDTQVLILRHF